MVFPGCGYVCQTPFATCLDSSKRCDGKKDCMLGDDELNCVVGATQAPTVQVPTAAPPATNKGKDLKSHLLLGFED